eukprot:2866314-Prymnesium_polylepis.1
MCIRDSSSFTARARGSYAATDLAELSFSKGDMLTVLGAAPKGWLYARLGESTGLVPQTFLERVEVKQTLVRGAQSSVTFVRCINCNKRVETPLLCGGCLCVSYCSAVCATQYEAAGRHSASDCADHARYMSRDVRVRLPTDPAWLREAMDHQCDVSLSEVLARMGDHTDPSSPYHLLYSYTPTSPHRHLVEPIPDTPGDVAQPSASAPLKRPTDPPPLPADWAAYYEARALPLDSPLATLLTFPLTVLQVLRELRLTDPPQHTHPQRP